VNKAHILIYGLALAAINLVAFGAGQDWDTWAHRQHPIAAQVPVGVLVSIIGILLLDLVSRALPTDRFLIQGHQAFFQIYGFALLIGLPLFVGCSFLLNDNGPSAGRTFTFLLFQSLANAVALHLVYSTRKVSIRDVVRRGIEKPWVSRSAAVGLGLLLSVLLLFLVEGLFYILNASAPAKADKVYSGEYLLPGKFFRSDEVLGISLIPDTAVTSILTIDGRPTWNVVYGTDRFGRRTSTAAGVGDRDEFAVFFGDSFLFGEGSNDEETIPSLFESRTQRYRAYNYGVPGYGTQQMLAKLQSNSLKDEVKEETGVLFYTYLEDVHEGRVAGQMNVVNAWATNFPFYDLDNDGNLVHQGTFTTGRPILNHIYRLLGRTQLARYLGLNLPNLGEEHYRLTARIIEESKELYEQQFPNSDFYVVLLPKKNAHRRILPYLEQAEIKYLDYLDLLDPNAPGYAFVGDGHPTPAANQALANQLGRHVSPSRD